MLPGFNHNIRHRELVFHVQTEDSGPGQYTVVTQLFLGGHVLAVERFQYDDLWSVSLEDGRRREALRARMQEQHKLMLRRLTEGHFDDRLAPFLRPATDARPNTASAFDAALPAELVNAAEALPSAPFAIPDPTTGPRTSVLRPPGRSVAAFDEISVEGLVDNLEEWSGSEPEKASESSAAPSDAFRRPAAGAQDTVVDTRLPAALRAAQERLRQQTASSSQRPVDERRVRRVEVRDVRPPTEPPPRAPSRSRPSIPSNDKTMLEIDPIALKQAMAKQRAKLEAQKKARQSQDLEPTRRDPPAQPEVISEPSLDEVIMGYLKDQD